MQSHCRKLHSSFQCNATRSHCSFQIKIANPVIAQLPSFLCLCAWCREEKVLPLEERSLSPQGPGRRSLSSETSPSKPQPAAAATSPATAPKTRPRPQSASDLQPRERPKQQAQQQRVGQGDASIDLMGLSLDDRASGTAANSRQKETVVDGNAGMDDLMGLHGSPSQAQPQVLISLLHIFRLCFRHSCLTRQES